MENNPLYGGMGKITALLAATVMAKILAIIADTRRQFNPLKEDHANGQ